VRDVDFKEIEYMRKTLIIYISMFMLLGMIACAFPSVDRPATEEENLIYNGFSNNIESINDPTSDNDLKNTDDIEKTEDGSNADNAELSSDDAKSDENLESFFSTPLNAIALRSFSVIPEGYESVFSDIKVSVTGNRMIYEYTYIGNIGDSQESLELNAQASKGRLFEALRQMLDTKDPMEIQFIYYNEDGSVAADFVLYEDEGSNVEAYVSQAKEGTIQYYYESVYGPDYWANGVKGELENNKDYLSDITVECVDNTLTYTYVLKNDAGDSLKDAKNNYTEEDKKNIIDIIKTPTGVKDDIKVIFIYKNPDGSVAAKVEFEG